jgi:outer membrane lipoprotein-sorting protein
MRAAFLAIVTLLPVAWAQDAAPSAQNLAARLTTAMQDGSSSVRLKMEIQRPAGGPKTVLQLQVKARRTKSGTDLIYSVLWPRDRKGECFLLRNPADRAPSGTLFSPPDSLRPIASSQMKEPVFGSDLSYEDLVENFFAWGQQAIVGTETVDRVPCQILESKPDKGERSAYSKVRSWIDVKRMVPLRVEKYSASGQLARRIDTTRVAKDDKDRLVPASLLVRRPGQDSVTEIEGSNSRHDVTYSDGDFTSDALRELAGSKSK